MSKTQSRTRLTAGSSTTTDRSPDPNLKPAAHTNPLPCQIGDPDLFFSESPGSLEVAKALCRECPLRAKCLAGALDRAEPWGVWGGEVFLNGSIVTHKRARGRPPKTRSAPSPSSFARPTRAASACWWN